MTETKEEEFWNTLTHFIGLIFSLIGLPVLVYYDNALTEFSIHGILFFEFGLICVYTASTLYHYTSNIELKKKFRVFDHISVFYLIAGSYAPVCLITLYDGSGIKILAYVIIIALIGTLFKIFFTGRFDRLFLLLYLCMGWLIIIDFDSILALIPLNGTLLLVLSGLLYSVGTIFYSLQKMKYSHAIWHVFVLGGSGAHYFVILFYVI
tara:strand:- start:1684 stop:2307 length:624 start_codon:yes stop_codon:yes gene_type:complete